MAKEKNTRIIPENAEKYIEQLTEIMSSANEEIISIKQQRTQLKTKEKEQKLDIKAVSKVKSKMQKKLKQKNYQKAYDEYKIIKQERKKLKISLEKTPGDKSIIEKLKEQKEKLKKQEKKLAPMQRLKIFTKKILAPTIGISLLSGTLITAIFFPPVAMGLLAAGLTSILVGVGIQHKRDTTSKKFTMQESIIKLRATNALLRDFATNKIKLTQYKKDKLEVEKKITGNNTTKELTNLINNKKELEKQIQKSIKKEDTFIKTMIQETKNYEKLIENHRKTISKLNKKGSEKDNNKIERLNVAIDKLQTSLKNIDASEVPEFHLKPLFDDIPQKTNILKNIQQNETQQQNKNLQKPKLPDLLKWVDLPTLPNWDPSKQSDKVKHSKQTKQRKNKKPTINR